MLIEHKNDSSYPPLMVRNISANQLDAVTEEHELPAIAVHFPPPGVDNQALIQEIELAIASDEGCQLIIQRAESILPEGFAIEKAVPCSHDGIQFTVIIPGQLYTQLFIANLVGLFK